MKTVSTFKKKFWQYLFWLGPVLIVMGLSAGVVSGTWKPVPLSLVVAGVVTIGLWLLFQARESHWWSRRSTQTSTNALVATLSVLVILGLVNFLANRYPTRVDLTETHMFTLAPESRQVVRNLQDPVKVWLFDRNQNPQDRELLENYRRQGSQFSFEYADPQAKPELAQKFGVKEFGEVYLEAKGQRRSLQVVNDQERLSEVKLTNGLAQVERQQIAKAYIIQGHGERPLLDPQGGLSQALSALKDKNYTSEPLNLTQQPIPQDATVVVLAGPKRGLFDQEVKALSDYLSQGGSLLLMIDPNTKPNLDLLLKDWGIKLGDGVVVDVSGTVQGFGPAVPIVTSYGNHPITKDFGNGISFYRLARPLILTPVAGVQATPLLLTKPYPQSWAKANLKSEDLKFDPKSDRKGPLVLGVAASRKVEPKAESKQQVKLGPSAPPLAPTSTSQPSEVKPSSSPSNSPSPTPTKSTSKQSEVELSPSPTASPTPSLTNTSAPSKPEKRSNESRLVVIGNSDFATDGLFDKQLNGDVFLNSISWLSQQNDQTLSIRPKEAKNRRINMTPQEANMLSWSSLLLLPLIGFGAGAMLWWRRR